MGAFLVAGTAAWHHFYISRPIGDGPAGPVVSAGPFAQRWGDRPVLLLGLGDSVTAGLGSSRGHSYFELLAANPPDEFADMQGRNLSKVFPNLNARNLAISGSTSLEHVKVQLPKLALQSTNVLGIVVITTGGNDLIHNYGRTPPREGAMYGATLEHAGPWITNFAARLEAILDGVRKSFPGGCHIFLANIYDPTDGAGDIESAGLPPWPGGLAMLRAYNEIIERCAGSHADVHMVDLQSEFLGHGIHCTKPWKAHYRRDDPHYWYYVNLEDPNDRGYDAIRRLFLNAMIPVLAPRE